MAAQTDTGPATAVTVKVDAKERTFRLHGDGTVTCDQLTDEHLALAIFAGDETDRARGLLVGANQAIEHGYVTADTFADTITRAAKRGRTKDLVSTSDVGVLAVLAHDTVWSTRKAVAQNPNCPNEILHVFLGDDAAHVRNASLRNRSLQDVDPAHLNASDASSRLEGITDPDALDHYANDSRITVKRGVASNPSTPPETLARLAFGSNDQRVSGLVARNPSTPPDTLVDLFDRGGVPAGLAATNPSFPPEVMRARITGPSGAVFLANSSCPPDLLHEIVARAIRDNGEEAWRHFMSIAGHPNAQADTLRMIVDAIPVGHPVWEHIDESVRANPNLTPELSDYLEAAATEDPAGRAAKWAALQERAAEVLA